jgi:hypothetical protein
MRKGAGAITKPLFHKALSMLDGLPFAYFVTKPGCRSARLRPTSPTTSGLLDAINARLIP